MRTLVLANQKGGVGKSTLAAHIAVALGREKGARVVIIDLDPQGSLSEWWNAREDDAPQYVQCERVADLPQRLEQLAAAGFDFCVIDTPPSVGPALEAAARAADLVIVPIQASAFDIKAAPKTVELFHAVGREFIFALNRVKGGRTTTSMQAAVTLSSVAPVFPSVIADRVVYASITQDGRTVYDLPATGKAAKETAKAHKEQTALMHFVLSRFPEYRPKPAKEKAHAL